jgi:hypothetical protein
MPDPWYDSLSVLVTSEGHASPRWRGAHSKLEAAALNYRLSERRAQTVYNQVERIIKQQLPGLPIPVKKRALGSSKPFPTTGDDNAAVDRCVVLLVDLDTTNLRSKIVQPKPRKIWAKSTLWKLEVVDYVSASLIGAAASFVRIRITNPITGKELYLAGGVFGGDLDISTDLLIGIAKGKLPKAKFFNFLGIKSLKDLKDVFKMENLIDKIVKRATKGHMGEEVWVHTPPMDFDDWMNGGKGQSVTFLHGEIKTPISKSYGDIIVLWDVEAEHRWLAWGGSLFSAGPQTTSLKAGVNDRFESGVLKPLNDPQDFYIWQDPYHYDIVHYYEPSSSRDGILISFPTEKADWHDLSRRQREDVKNYVMVKVEVIRSLARDSRKIEPPAQDTPPI